MPVPDFSPGEVLTAAAMDSIGLWLVKTQTVGAGVGSVTVSDAFSADYDNYRIIYSGGSLSSSAACGLRVGGATTNYKYVLIWSSALGGAVNQASATTANFFPFAGGGDTDGVFLSCDILAPFLSGSFTGFATGSYLQTNDFGTCQGKHVVQQSNTSVTVLPSTGTMTGGTIRVYGYRN